MVASAGSKQVIELQSLRGLAALVVLLHHTTVYYALPAGWHEAAERVFDGRAAVILFFVLSGYVLTLSLTRQPITVINTLKFYYRRGWRIYPAMIFALAIGVIYWLLFRGMVPPPIVSNWMSPEYREVNVTAVDAIRPFLGFGAQFPVAIWTISIELIGSLVIPLVALALVRSRWVFWALTVALAGVAILMAPKLFSSTEYLVYFALGASVVLWSDRVAGWLRSDRSAVLAATAAALVLVLIQQIPGWRAGTGSTAPDLAYLLEGLAATALVGIVAARHDALPLLRHRSLIFLGDISYGLYLLHLPVLVLVAGFGTEWLALPPMTTNPFTATAILASVTLIITIPLSWMTYRFIELPGISMGRRLPGRPRLSATT